MKIHCHLAPTDCMCVCVYECERVQVAEVKMKRITFSPNLLATTKIRAGIAIGGSGIGRIEKGKSHLLRPPAWPPKERRVQGVASVRPSVHRVPSGR